MHTCQNATLIKARCMYLHVMIGLFNLASTLTGDSEFPIPLSFKLIEKFCTCKQGY